TYLVSTFFVFNAPTTPQTYTLSLHDALPILKVPLMIDSTDAAVIELALRHCQGKAIVNSINLEDGEERFEKVGPLLRVYGAAVRSEEHTSELQSLRHLVCRLLLEKKK